jgi:hypothetical protein
MKPASEIMAESIKYRQEMDFLSEFANKHQI